MLLVHNILGCIYTSEVAELLLMCIFMLKKVVEGVWTMVNFVSLFFKRSRYDPRELQNSKWDVCS